MPQRLRQLLLRVPAARRGRGTLAAVLAPSATGLLFSPSRPHQHRPAPRRRAGTGHTALPGHHAPEPQLPPTARTPPQAATPAPQAKPPCCRCAAVRCHLQDPYQASSRQPQQQDASLECQTGRRHPRIAALRRRDLVTPLHPASCLSHLHTARNHRKLPGSTARKGPVPCTPAPTPQYHSDTWLL